MHLWGGGNVVFKEFSNIFKLLKKKTNIKYDFFSLYFSSKHALKTAER